jgi:hypothetical protein
MHSTTKIQVEVHCVDNTFSPSYRLYLDDTLMTERTFIWDNTENCIDEEMITDINKGEHHIKIELVKPPGEFTLKNVRVNGNSVIGTQFVI